MMRKSALAAVLLSLTAGGLLAAECITQAMPPFKITVTLDDIKSAGTPALAFFKGLDDAGEKLVGKTLWRETQFVGYVTVVHRQLWVTSTNIQYVQKPCGQTVEESEGSGDIVQNPPGTGGGNGGGNPGGIGGWNPPGTGGCYGNCQPPYGEVGPIQQI
ncbi:hypothetical protein [Stenotrophomonas sp. SY1]|uniref:hypothetical protein n=1 Tax=Stenotrophomonas sp. SY1 TaxID=477235 RepID=UPI001E28CA33|nr:hypothetical protein [Stenotrophomonas sp. SY1]MCD9088741.1 hypothetical protein [Stenotrophomonas sp. SY1]